jgi:hypothetical protein
VPQTDTYIEKDSSLNEEVERLRHSAPTPCSPARRHRRGDGLCDLRSGYAPGVRRAGMVRLRVGDEMERDSLLRRLVGTSTRATTFPARGVLSGARGHARGLPDVRRARGPGGVLRRRDREAEHPAIRSPGRSSPRIRRSTCSRQPLRGRAGAEWSGRSGASRLELDGDWLSWNARRSCWRLSASGCGPATTSR